MKKKRYLALFPVAVFMVLCACGQHSLPETTAPGYEEPSTETVVVVSESAAETTEMTEPLHSSFYDPQYTQEEILEYFAEVVLHVEYTDGIGDSTLVQKWLSPIHYRISGSPTEEDLAVLEAFFADLNRMDGFPGILETPEGETEQLRISFLEPDIFRSSYSYVVGGEDATGATEFWYYTDTNEIHSARIGYRTDIDQSIRNSVLIEEIVNTLGISDTLLREDSVTYQYSDFNTALSKVDRILLNLLYHPDICCGMDAEACSEVIRQLYY